jgi:hypothetical protein
MVDYIVNKIPQFLDVARPWEEDIFDDNAYAAVSELYRFAVREYAAEHFNVVLRILELIEEAVGSGDPSLADPISIDFVEKLAGSNERPCEQFFMKNLGPLTRKDLDGKRP